MADRGREHALRRFKILGAMSVVFLTTFVVYRLTDRPLKVIDVRAVAHLPISLLLERDLDLDEFPELRRPGLTFDYEGRLVSAFPFWPAFQLLPTYALLILRGDPPTEEMIWPAQRLAAQLSMALTVTLLALLLFRLHGFTVSALATVGFAFGTINWFVLSQLAFTNGLVQLWVTLALVLGLWSTPPPPLAGTASLLSLVVATFYRLSLAPFAGVWALYLLWHLRRRALPACVAAGVLAASMALANHLYMGEALGFYGYQAARMEWVSPNLGTALFGNLLSPSRGMWVFSPWLLLVLIGPVGFVRDRRIMGWILVLGCCGHLLVTSNYLRWYGGGSMGPRLSADVLPAYAVVAASGIAWSLRRGWAIGVATVLLAVSCVIAGTHAFSDSNRWEYTPFTIDLTPDRLFDWRDALVLEPFRSTSYEERYPIRLLAPEPEARLDADKVTLRWQSEEASTKTVVDIAFQYGTRGFLVDRVAIDAPEPGLLVLSRDQLPRPLAPRGLLAWRVRALNSRGNIVSRSAWRPLYWQHQRVNDAI